MDNFRIIYKVLKLLERGMDAEEFDASLLCAEQFHISEPHFARIMALLVHEGYVTGIDVWHVMEQSYPCYCVTRPDITLKGLEYLQDNSLMRKAAAAAKGVKDVIPGI